MSNFTINLAFLKYGKFLNSQSTKLKYVYIFLNVFVILLLLFFCGIHINKSSLCKDEINIELFNFFFHV